jgi:pimeloyl-ACP methyl ester carboxylesterase
VAFEDDRVIPKSRTDEFLDHRPSTQLVTLPGGHLAMHTDPLRLRDEIVRFIRNQHPA